MDASVFTDFILGAMKQAEVSDFRLALSAGDGREGTSGSPVQRHRDVFLQANL